MKEKITLLGDSLTKEQYFKAVRTLQKKGYTLVVDPFEFDAPMDVAARFLANEPKIRFVELTPRLEVSILHNLPKQSEVIKKILRDFESCVTLEIPEATKKEATIGKLIYSDAIVEPRKRQRQEFQDLEAKGIFTGSIELHCPSCDQSFFVPTRDMYPKSGRAFCAYCKQWFAYTARSTKYVLNESYLAAATTTWDKLQKIIRSGVTDILSILPDQKRIQKIRAKKISKRG